MITNFWKKVKAKWLFSQIVKFKFRKAHEKIAQSTSAGAKSSSLSLPQRKAYLFCFTIAMKMAEL